MLLVELVLLRTAQVERWKEYLRPYVTSCQVVIAVPVDLIRLVNYWMAQFDDSQYFYLLPVTFSMSHSISRCAFSVAPPCSLAHGSLYPHSH